jgi:hypothetical protein
MTKLWTDHQRAEEPSGYKQNGEQGIALFMTILIITIMGLLAGAGLMATVQSSVIAAQNSSYAAALGAADSGVDDLLYRLNANEDTSFQLAQNIYNYDQQLRLASSAPCPTSASPALPPGACGWVTIPEDNDNVRFMQYQYSIPSDHPPAPTGAATTAGSTGSSLLIFDVTGRVVPNHSSTVSRSIRVVLSRSTFLNYGYFTNVETEDPQQYDLDPAQAGWPEFGSYGGTGATAWNGNPTQATQPKNAYDAALEYCQNYWFGANLAPNEATQAATAGVAISEDPRSVHSETSGGYSLNNICTFTKWETGDTFYGPVRTNDVFFVDGETNFYGPVVVGTPCNMLNSGDPGASQAGCSVLGEGSQYTPDAANNDGEGVYWIDTQPILSTSPAAVTPTFTDAPKYAPPVNLPPSNPNLAEQAAADGCVYEGMTYFDFLSSGNVYVYSPGTAAAVTAGTFTLNSGCSANGQVTLSSHPVLYVNQASGTGCLDSTSSDYTFGGLVQSNDYYPGLIANYRSGTLHQWQYGTSPATDPLAFACNNGDAWVGGVVSGSVTVGAAHNVVVYQNITYANTSYLIAGTTVSATGSDVIGLEPTDDVVVYHPVDCPSWDSNWKTSTAASCVNPNPAINDFGSACPLGQATTWAYGSSASPADCQVNQIDGAILAFQGEYTAENYALGPSMGTLTEFGSVSQAYRGRLAGTGAGGGYAKQYIYDPRLASLSPPNFLPPGLFNWSEANWSEISGQVQALTSNTEVVPAAPAAPVPTSPMYTVPPSTSTTTTVPGTTTTTSSTTTTVPRTTTTAPTTTTSTSTTTTSTTTTSTTTTSTTTTSTTTTSTTTTSTTTTPHTAPSFPSATTQIIDYCYATAIGTAGLYPAAAKDAGGPPWGGTSQTSFSVTTSGGTQPITLTPVWTGTGASGATDTLFTYNTSTGAVTYRGGASAGNNVTLTVVASNGTAPNATSPTYSIVVHTNVGTNGC